MLTAVCGKVVETVIQTRQPSIVNFQELKQLICRWPYMYLWPVNRERGRKDEDNVRGSVLSGGRPFYLSLVTRYKPTHYFLKSAPYFLKSTRYFLQPTRYFLQSTR